MARIKSRAGSDSLNWVQAGTELEWTWRRGGWLWTGSWIRGGISCAPPGRGSIFLAASAWSSSASSDYLHALRFTSCSGVGSRLDIRISVSLIGSLSRIDPHRVGAEATLRDLKFWTKSIESVDQEIWKYKTRSCGCYPKMAPLSRCGIKLPGRHRIFSGGVKNVTSFWALASSPDEEVLFERCTSHRIW